MNTRFLKRIAAILLIFSVGLLSSNLPIILSPPVSGLTQAVPVGKFLNDSLPSLTPAGGGNINWGVAPAFPNLTFNDPLVITMHPDVTKNVMFVASRDGHIHHFVPEDMTTQKYEVADFRDTTAVVHDGGFLGMVFHPEFESNPNKNFVYIYATVKGDDLEWGPDTPNPGCDGECFSCANDGRFYGSYLRLARYAVTISNGRYIIDYNSQLRMINIAQFNATHRGGGLVFGDDGLLYLTIGDQARRTTAQDPDILEGGVLRLDVDMDYSASHDPTLVMGPRVLPRYNDQNQSAPPINVTTEEITGQGYLIPDDNPQWYTDGTPYFEEFLTIGHRAPHRMTKDRMTGDLWIGEVGAGSREEINVIQPELIVGTAGGNYGWPKNEGYLQGQFNACGSNNLVLNLGTVYDPVVDFPRSGAKGANAIMGGYVYRGKMFESVLGGKYICGGYSQNRIMAITFKKDVNGKIVPDFTNGGSYRDAIEELTSYTPGRLITFGEDHDGELYMGGLGNNIPLYKLTATGVGVDAPTNLSETGAFKNLITLEPADGVIPYEMIEPFWSDAADKFRWIAIPNDGTHDTSAEMIQFSENGDWMFPAGTVLIKHFEYKGRRLETRFEVKADDGLFYYLDYVWNEAGTEATLQYNGLTEDITIQGETITWRFPSTSECLTCHQTAVGNVLGVRTKNLNSAITYPTTGVQANQLVSLSSIGVFDQTITANETANFVSVAAKDDLTQSLEYRARSYLDVNCAYCHQPATGNRAVFDARLTTPLDQQNLINGAIGSSLGLNNPFVIVPQDKDRSMAHFRMNSLNPDQMMPPLAKAKVDADGLQLIEDWINSLDLVPPPDPEPGLIGNYYDNDGGTDKFQTKKFDQIDATINYNWGTGSPNAAEVGNDDFAVQWTGLVTPDYSETYTFYTNSDDGVRLWVNGTQIIDNWTNHAPTINTGNLALTAGSPVSLVLEFYERGGGAVIELEWSSSSQTRQIIPAGKFSHIPAGSSSGCSEVVMTTLLDANFNSGTDGLSYVDDVFRSTNQPNYATGSRTSNQGFGSTGGLLVQLGGVNDDDITNMSGGWSWSFNLPQAAEVEVSFRYRLFTPTDYESDEFSQVLLRLDDLLIRNEPNDYWIQINDGGDSGWQQAQANLGRLDAGNHTLYFGGFNNKKTTTSERTDIYLDDIVVTRNAADNNRPVAFVNVDQSTGGFPLAVNFDAGISYDPDGNPLMYSWDFGDNSTGSGYSVSHTYTSSGSYTAKLTLMDDQGCSDEESFQIVVSPSQSPTASLSAYPTSGAASLVVVLDGSASTDPESDVLTYSWDFGDGVVRSGSDAQTTHTYTQPGIYTATLTVSDSYSQSKFSETITVNSHETDLGIFTTAEDIGSLNAAGSSSYMAGAYTVSGSGTGFGDDPTDANHFLYRPHEGDAELIAQVTSMCNTSNQARAALMIRDSNTESDYFFAVEQFSDLSVRASWRDANGETNSTILGNMVDPKYLRLIRIDNFFIAYYSTNAANGPWTQIALAEIAMGTETLIGLAVTSGVDNQLCDATFESVSLDGPVDRAPTLAKVRIQLQGPWNGTDMDAVLFTQDLLPLNQPYTESYWDFEGREEVLNIPDLDGGYSVVDWVLVRIHDANDKSVILAERACFVRDDGWVLDLAGNDVIDFGVTLVKNGYLSINHRNHLPVMTATPISFD